MAENTTDPDGAPRAENSLWHSPKRRAQRPHETADPASETRAGTKRSDSVPEEVKRRFVEVKNKYYFPDGARAFTDRGTRLTTPSENTEVVRSLVEIARARGWTEVTVRGTDRFRKEAWTAARLAGIEVKGYTPSEFEQGHLARTLARRAERGDVNDVERDPAPQGFSAEAKDRRTSLIVGTLVDQGRASYRHDPKEAMSYFVKLETPRGERIVWGVDLERASRESLTQPKVGDEVALRAVRAEPVTIKARDDAGKLTAEIQAKRNRWVFEKREFFTERAEAARTIRDAAVKPKAAVKSYPELVGTYLQVHAAELAAKRIRDPEDQKRFVQMVRSALADSVARGEPLPAVRLKEPAVKREPKTPSPIQARVLG
jgi:conjugative element/phage-associated large polyvalent protein